ncbi:5839_t:CDS:2 [Acaulospora colombiana]|uniref:5839_t:CDS:1 n=1 Tax=Acaulospora colombiana TaxID=27376 RepID=A0ACA9MCW1_9GLOM|nr:5839_t:CDS:2 [Acaulospora colombiana]
MEAYEVIGNGRGREETAGSYVLEHSTGGGGRSNRGKSAKHVVAELLECEEGADVAIAFVFADSFFKGRVPPRALELVLLTVDRTESSLSSEPSGDGFSLDATMEERSDIMFGLMGNEEGSDGSDGLSVVYVGKRKWKPQVKNIQSMELG